MNVLTPPEMAGYLCRYYDTKVVPSLARGNLETARGKVGCLHTALFGSRAFLEYYRHYFESFFAAGDIEHEFREGRIPHRELFDTLRAELGQLSLATQV